MCCRYKTPATSRGDVAGRPRCDGKKSAHSCSKKSQSILASSVTSSWRRSIKSTRRGRRRSSCSGCLDLGFMTRSEIAAKSTAGYQILRFGNTRNRLLQHKIRDLRLVQGRLPSDRFARLYEFRPGSILQLQRRSPSTGGAAASQVVAGGPQWAEWRLGDNLESGIKFEWQQLIYSSAPNFVAKKMFDLGCLPLSNIHLVSGPTMTVGSGSCDVQQRPSGGPRRIRTPDPLIRSSMYPVWIYYTRNSIYLYFNNLREPPEEMESDNTTCSRHIFRHTLLHPMSNDEQLKRPIHRRK